MSAQRDRRFLVLGRVGDKSLHKHWIDGPAEQRNWDLALNAYGKDEARVQDGDLPTVIDRGTKFDSIVRHVRQRPELLDRYDYIAIPDDDLLLGPEQFNRFFDIVREYNLTVAQMSLTLESYFSHGIVLQIPKFKLRYSNFVESMACCVKTSYFRELLVMFDHYSTGWGVDMVWAMTMKNPNFKSAIIDAVAVTHTRPMHTGALYVQYKAEKRSPIDDVDGLKASFDNFRAALIPYGGVLETGRVVGAAEVMRRTATHLAAVAPRSTNWKKALRFATITAIRSVTDRNYVPPSLIPRAEAPDWLKVLCATDDRLGERLAETSPG
jgi:hypothetical protein